MLTEKLNHANEMISALLSEKKALLLTFATVEKAFNEVKLALENNTNALTTMIRERDSLIEALKVAPEAKDKGPDTEIQRQQRAAVFLQMRQFPNTWIKPFGIAALTGLGIEDVCAILRRASKIDGIPLEHNGERGQGSMYRWTGEPLVKK